MVYRRKTLLGSGLVLINRKVEFGRSSWSAGCGSTKLCFIFNSGCNADQRAEGQEEGCHMEGISEGKACAPNALALQEKKKG